MSRRPVVAVAGATGAVGKEMLDILEQRDFPAEQVIPMASSRSAGSGITFRGKELTVQEITEDSFQGVDLALFSAGGAASEKFAPLAVSSGCVVVDNSNAWRMDAQTPLVVPEVNPQALENHRGLIANPNCSTIQMVVALKPLYDVSRIKRIVVSTYQAVSGSGQKAINELESQVRHLFNGKEPECEVYPYQIAFNCLPHIDKFMDNDYTGEEMKMVNETRKIFEDPHMGISPTTVRVPVFYGHSEAVNVETEDKISAPEARGILSQAPGVTVLDNPKEDSYPMAVYSAGEDDTFVGRIREDDTIECGLNLWVVSDNIRKGAALNTIQIAETLLENDLLRVSA